MIFLERGEDLEWLAQVHKVPVDGVMAATLEGNEDCPSRVTTYARNNINCPGKVYVRDAEGNLQPE